MKVLSWKEFLSWPKILNLIPFFLMALTWAWAQATINKPHQGRKVILKEMGKLLLLVTVWISFLFITSFKADAILKALNRWFGLYGMRAVISGCVIGSGFAGYYWKQKNQRIYGLSEVLFGVLAASFITFTLTPEKSFLSQWIGLGGASYVIARGLNNISEAREKLMKSTSA